jgi:hypothetical protein
MKQEVFGGFYMLDTLSMYRYSVKRMIKQPGHS